MIKFDLNRHNSVKMFGMPLLFLARWYLWYIVHNLYLPLMGKGSSGWAYYKQVNAFKIPELWVEWFPVKKFKFELIIRTDRFKR